MRESDVTLLPDFITKKPLRTAKRANVVLKPVMTHKERVREFLSMIPHDGPVLVIDLNLVRQNYRNFRTSLPEARVFYAVKSNPAPDLLKLLADEGANFDVASVAEVAMALKAGAAPERISFGNTIKKERDIAWAYKRGIRMFAVDSVSEVQKIARAAPGSKVYCRLLCKGEGAKWPLSRKFGCEPDMAVEVMTLARDLGLIAYGISFHPGSQQLNMGAWDEALSSVAGVFKRLDAIGIPMSLINMGGGFPAKYSDDIPAIKAYAKNIRDTLKRHFGNRQLDLIIEPGRGMCGNAGVIRAEVVLISEKSTTDKTRWVYLDIGKFGGLAETDGEVARYPITTGKDKDPKSPCILAGPTCDSADILYEKTPYPLPDTLAEGDLILIHSAGAYTTTYATAGFNGFAPLKALCIQAD